MNAALIFTVSDPMPAATLRCRQAVTQLGSALRSDSGHYITGVVTSGHNNVDVRVTWLEFGEGTQITVSASHEDLQEAELENVTQRFRYEYLHHTSLVQKRKWNLSAASMLYAAGALAAIVVFIVALLRHKS